MVYMLTKKGKARIKYQIRKMVIEECKEHIPTMGEVLEALNKNGVERRWRGTASYIYNPFSRHRIELDVGVHIEPDLSGVENGEVREAALRAARIGLTREDLVKEAQCVEDYGEWQHIGLMGFTEGTLRAAAELF